MNYADFIQNVSDDDLRLFCEESKPIEPHKLTASGRRNLASFAINRSIQASKVAEAAFGKNIAGHIRTAFNAAWTNKGLVLADDVCRVCDGVNLRHEGHRLGRLSEDSLRIVKAVLLFDVYAAIQEIVHPTGRQSILSVATTASWKDPARGETFFGVPYATRLVM